MTDNRKTVLIVDTMAAAGRTLLEDRKDVRIVAFPMSTTTDQLLEIMRREPRIDGMILGVQKIGPDQVTASKGLQVVARIGVGYDAIHVPTLTAAGIPLMTTGQANSPSVAEQALYFMLAFAKRGPQLDAMVKAGRWMDRMKLMPTDLYGKTVLVIGCGRIGSRVVKRCNAMEMQVLVYDPFVKPEAIAVLGAEQVKSIDAALPRADYVTVHCPKDNKTTGMIGPAQLARMKPTAILVNTARGGIVDEMALAEALRGGQIAGAGLDVLLDEPPPNDHPLLKMDNVLTAPHMAGVTREAFDRMCAQAAKNVLSVFDGNTIKENVVNQDALKS
jgi:D-3-phosphoglycerate dehydrogenase / 2-oxoglutarate reductase